MPTRSVIFNRLATKDFREARDWYAVRSTNAAVNFVNAIDAAVSRILTDFDALPAVSKKFRRVPVENFPHNLIFYARTDTDIRVVAVAHPSRRPGYWRHRT